MTEATDIELLKNQVNSLIWVHSIDLGHGIVTPGQWAKPQPLIEMAFNDIDFVGKKVLDIGCWDGLWSFEAEKRGAAFVYATDDISQRSYKEQKTFHLAHRILGSQVKYFDSLSVFDVKNLGVNDFDLVLFCGVHYHLRDPLLALAKLRQVIKPEGLILVEGDVIYGSDESYAEFFYHNVHGKDYSVWWIPTIPCFREWIESSFFEIVKEYSLVEAQAARSPRRVSKGLRRYFPRRTDEESMAVTTFKQRISILARAIRRKDPHYIFPDPDFKDFDLNEYS